ncbi:MAG: sugar transferase [Candidatus Omnitrophica bacterium]|nr:sugar transferase [Candidatus Omnitrophota bacterium]
MHEKRKNTELRQEWEKLVFAWKMHLAEQVYLARFSLRNRFYKNLSKFKTGFLGLGFLFVFSGCIILLMRKAVYAQASIGLEEAAYYVYLQKLASWVIGGGLLSVVVGMARRNYLFFKRAFDLLAAILGLVILSPLFLIIAILIKVDSSGPVFFRQRRLGLEGKIFNIWKFRTMRENAELETGPVWAYEDDPRITRIGAFLRESGLDALPQLMNVLSGRMSLIGPCSERPELAELIYKHNPDFKKRLKVKPGITGLAQVRFCYTTSFKDALTKLRYDLLYIDKMCWFLDFKIMFWTLANRLTD